MFDIKFSHTSTSNGSSAKQFYFIMEPGTVVHEKVPPQAQQILQVCYTISTIQETFTYADIIKYIDTRCESTGTTFTNSKGGTERIVRYYAKLMQTIGAISTEKPTPPADTEETPESE